jgi:hypothetical protein
MYLLWIGEIGEVMKLDWGAFWEGFFEIIIDFAPTWIIIFMFLLTVEVGIYFGFLTI